MAGLRAGSPDSGSQDSGSEGSRSEDSGGRAAGSGPISVLADLFATEGADEYLGEPVTQASHMLQAAALAKAVIEIMAWTKLKMGIGIGVGIILATTVVPAAWRIERRHA